MREADGGGHNTIQGLFSSDLHFLSGYLDVKDRWNNKLLGRLYFIISFGCIYEFRDDNKQEILEPNLFNVFC